MREIICDGSRRGVVASARPVCGRFRVVMGIGRFLSMIRSGRTFLGRLVSWRRGVGAAGVRLVSVLSGKYIYIYIEKFVCRAKYVYE